MSLSIDRTNSTKEINTKGGGPGQGSSPLVGTRGSGKWNASETGGLVSDKDIRQRELAVKVNLCKGIVTELNDKRLKYDLNEAIKKKASLITSIECDSEDFSMEEGLKFALLIFYAENLKSLTLGGCLGEYYLNEFNGEEVKKHIEFNDWIDQEAETNRKLLNLFHCFKSLKKLEELFIKHWMIEDKNLKLILDNCKNLKKLDLSSWCIPKEKINLIGDAGLNLEELSLWGGIGSSPNIMDSLDRLKKINSLGLRAVNVGDVIIDRFSESFLVLKFLSLQKFIIEPSVLKSILTKCKNLTDLILINCQGVEDELFAIDSNEKLSLTHILLEKENNITDEGVKAIVKNCPELHSLRLPLCEKLTSGWIESVIQNCKNLERLEFSFNEESYKIKDIDVIFDKLSKLKVLVLYIDNKFLYEVMKSYTKEEPRLRVFDKSYY